MSKNIEIKRQKTRETGVYFKLLRRLDGRGVEKVYYVRFRNDGKSRELLAGRQYKDGMTPLKAARIRLDYIEGRRLSVSEQRLQNYNIEKDKISKTLPSMWKRYTEKRDKKGRLMKDKSSFRTDLSRYNKYVLAYWGESRSVSNLNDFDIKSYTEWLYSQESSLSKSLSPQSIKHCLALLRRILKYNGAQICSIQMPVVDNNTSEKLDREQIQAIIAAANKSTPDIKRMLLFVLHTGVRRGELVKMQWNNIDFDRGTLLLVDPKGGKNILLPLSSSALEILEDQPRTSRYVFPGRKGNRRCKDNVTRRFKRLMRLAGIGDEFRPIHGLRHVFADLLVGEGIAVPDISKLLGHKDITTTTRYFTGGELRLRNAVEKLTAHLKDE